MNRAAAADGLNQAARILGDLVTALQSENGSGDYTAILDEISLVFGPEAQDLIIRFLDIVLEDADQAHARSEQRFTE